MLIAYLGPEATYTHQAALQIARRHGAEATLEPKVTIDDVFLAVQQGQADRGVVPFENSSNGSVVFTLDLFNDLKGKNPDIIVVDEAYVAVHHCLVGRKPLQNGIEETRDSIQSHTSHIAKLYSHPQAWGQCIQFLNANLKGVERQDVSSTSRGAQIVADEGLTSSNAAISSRLAAELYGLDIIAEGIEDKTGNETRFLVLQNAQTSKVDSSLEEATPARYKTLITFAIEHTLPGALADALAVFKKHELSLTSINTRPSGDDKWTYTFFVELWGGEDTGNQNDTMSLAIKDLATQTRSCRWLGTWKSALMEH